MTTFVSMASPVAYHDLEGTGSKDEFVAAAVPNVHAATDET